MRWPATQLAPILLTALILPIPAAAPATELPSVETFFRHPSVRSAALSPSGSYLAIVERLKTGRYVLAVLPTDNPVDAHVIADGGTTDILAVEWVNERRLVFSTGDLTGDGLVPGLNGQDFAVDRDGSELRRLGWGAFLGDLPPLLSNDANGDEILFARAEADHVDGSLRHLSPLRMNTRTAKSVDLVEPPLPALAKGWIFDKQDVARIFIATEKDRRRIYYRDGPGKNWQVLGDFDVFSNEGFTPSFFDYQGNLYVVSGGTATSALYRYDLAHRKLDDQPVLNLEGFDYRGQPLFDRQTKKTLGFHYLTDARGTYWLDEKMKGIQARLDQRLPNTVNEIHCGDCLGSKMLLVTSFSDRVPIQYLLFNTETDQLIKVADARPGIVPAQMGPREFTHFTARDGLTIPVYITRPPGKQSGPLPTVVMVHGGPWVRGASWEFSPIPEFLASRGYVVIEPEFRGSVGFGWTLYRSSWKQWGLSMQDDLADAAKWAIDSGVSDPKRIAIAGASYGGYATLMGLIKNPELFRCGFEWVGVTDIGLMYSVQWNDASIASLEIGMPALVGDPVKDAEQLRQTSPLASASKLTQPLLMAYGADDRRVPLVQGEKFRSAVSETNKKVEWIVYPGEGHGWYIEDHDIDFWTRVEHFLDANLKNTAAAQ